MYSYVCVNIFNSLPLCKYSKMEFGLAQDTHILPSRIVEKSLFWAEESTWRRKNSLKSGVFVENLYFSDTIGIWWAPVIRLSKLESIYTSASITCFLFTISDLLLHPSKKLYTTNFLNLTLGFNYTLAILAILNTNEVSYRMVWWAHKGEKRWVKKLTRKDWKDDDVRKMRTD